MSDGSLEIWNSTFNANHAAGAGGGLGLHGGRALISGCHFSNNSAASGGALAASGSATVVNVMATRLSSNTASGSGGALHAQGGTVILANTTLLLGNTAGQGGASLVLLSPGQINYR